MTSMDESVDLTAWIGRVDTATDIAAAGPLERLAALLDHDTPPWPQGELPPLGHWLYFLPNARQSAIDRDGHPRRGGFLPPVPLPRRMWAGGTIDVHAPVAIGAALKRISTIRDVRHKTGASGPLVFVTVEHAIEADGTLAIVERQDLVYRDDARPAPTPPVAAPAIVPSASERAMRVDPVALFRFSALTFNGHRIHYDRDYARDVEGYAGLVVHGPLTATLLIDHLLRTDPGARVTRFAFRGVRPLLDIAPFTLCLDRTGNAAALRCRDDAGYDTMTAQATLAG